MGKQKIITVFGTNYIYELIPSLLDDCLKLYSQRNLHEKNFQVSPKENRSATAGIVLTYIAFESLRNRVYYLKKRKIKRNNVAGDLTRILNEYDNNLDNIHFQQILTEIAITRDAIIHNHLYEITYSLDQDWNLTNFRHRFLKDQYGDKKRSPPNVNPQLRTTKCLKLNIQPTKINFEDLFKILVVYDLFIGTSSTTLPSGYILPGPFYYKYNDKLFSSLSKYLTEVYLTIDRSRIDNRTKLKKILRTLSNTYHNQCLKDREIFLSNVCYNCGEFGFRRLNGDAICNRCGRQLRIIPKSVSPLR